MDETNLIDKILHRDKHALHEFYQTYTPKLLRYMQHKISNPHDAEEVFQDTLLAFLESARDFQGNCSIVTFLYSIGKHKIVDYYRRKKIRHFVFSQAPFIEELVSPMLNPEEAFDGILLKEKLKKAFSQVLPNYRLVLELKYIEDFSVFEIAKQCTWSVKKTESLLFRARKAFMKVYGVV